MNAPRLDPAPAPEVAPKPPVAEVAQLIVDGGAFVDADAVRLAEAYLRMIEEQQL